MPNKTIYVRDEDLPIFEQAEELGGDSLSAVIAEALRRFVDVKRAEAQGMKEITLEVGRVNTRGGDDTRKIRFVGRKLAGQTAYTGQTSSQDDRGTDYAIHQTRAGKIIISWRHWSCWDGEGISTDYAILDQLPGHNDQVYGRLGADNDFADQYPEKMPGGLLQEAAEALGQELVEWVE